MVTLFINGCTSSEALHNEPPNENNENNENNAANENLPSIAGICLDDAAEIVDMILGEDYEETFSEIEGHFGESYYMRDYKDGLSLIIGKDTGKVLEIELTSTKYKTWLGTRLVILPTRSCQNTVKNTQNPKPFTVTGNLKAGLM